ncbi:MAG: TonB-dependent receptor plug domain-containing protein [Thermodesulfobacteriota bacterium]|nr:TonB-dependent receptor plug domain-containing protein [Thermodesulfobacteriota bacterium]
MLKPTLAFFFIILVALPFNADAFFDETQAREQDQLLDMSLEELLNLRIIVESVSKSKESADLAPASVSVLSRRDLRDWNVDYFYELAGRVPGLAFYDVDYAGLKGFITRGIPGIWRMGLSYNLAPQADWGWQIFTPNFVKNIEITKGPAGLTWGSNAMFGHINVNLRDDLDGAEVEARVGENNFRHVDLMYGEQFENDNFFFLGYSRQENEPGLTTDFSDISGSAGDTWSSVAYDEGTDLLVANAKYNRFRFNLMRSTAIMPIRMHWFDDPGAFQADLELQSAEPVGHRFEALVYRLQYDLLDSDRGNIHLYYNYDDKHFWIESFYQSREKHYQVGFNGNLNFMENRLNLAFGSDLHDEHKINTPGWQSSWVRDLYGWSGRDDGTFGGQQGITKAGDKRNFFLQASQTVFDQLKLVLGGRLDWQEDREPDETLFMGPRAGLVWFPNEDLTLKYIYNSTPRPPAGNELQSASIPDPEELVAHELVANFKQKDKFSLQAGLFYQELSDIIVSKEGDIFDYENLSTTFTSRGVELGIRYVFNSMFNLTLNGTYTDTDVPAGVAGIPRDEDGRSLAVPTINTFASLQFINERIGKCNLSMRNFFDIPYETTTEGVFDEASATFLDFRFESRSFFRDIFTVGFSVKNILDEDEELPLLGEHTAVPGEGHPYPGSISPTPRQFYVFANARF